MTKPKPYAVAVLWAVVSLSSLTMLALFWRFPVPTCIASTALLATLLRCARFAKLIDLGTAAADCTGSNLRELDHQRDHHDSGLTSSF
jgi:hypothetical protein